MTNISFFIIMYKTRRGDMEPKDYEIIKIDGEYAVLRRADVQEEQTMLIAMALLPFGSDVGTRLHWENLEYTVI